jgi:hypothetical protein
MNYLGPLSRQDPLYRYLHCDILPQVGVSAISPDFQVFAVEASNHVYVYEELSSRTRIVGKFFYGASDRSYAAASSHMEREFHNLSYLRSIDFAGYPHYIPRPLGCNAEINCVLVEEFCYGAPLDFFIMAAIREGARETLLEKLAALAYFLASLHKTTSTENRVDVNKDFSYFERLTNQLRKWGHIGGDEAKDFLRLNEQWRSKEFIREDNQVLVHGDVTPSNILFGDGPWVIAIDLEHLKTGDRVFDLGRVVAEIKHFFMQYMGDKWLAEPYIGHFLREYASHFPDRDTTFRSITDRVPFHMGMNLLRIARNSWITDHHRLQLLDEAKMTLR